MAAHPGIVTGRQWSFGVFCRDSHWDMVPGLAEDGQSKQGHGMLNQQA